MSSEKNDRQQPEKERGIVDKVKAAEKKVEERLTILWNDLPSWQRDNHFIRSGYRPASNSFARSVASLLYLHNESVNVYTHLGGCCAALLAAAWAAAELRVRYPTATREDAAVFACFFAGAACCLGMSAAFHLTSNHSERVASFGNKLDYLGIVALIWGSFVPTIYYGFQRDPEFIRPYWAMITTIGVGCAVVSVSPKFRTPALRPFRAAMFVAMGLSGLFPISHTWRLYGLRDLAHSVGFYWVALQGVLYILGAGLYAARLPERLKPGAFDIWGSSHQIFHVLVVLAATSHLVGMIKAFDHWHTQRHEPVYLRLFGSSLW